MIPKRPPRPYNAWAARGMDILDGLTRGRWYTKPEAPVRRLTDKPRPEIFDEPKR